MHRILAGHDVKNWADIMEEHESEALVMDEVEEALDVCLDRNVGGAESGMGSAVTIKRVEQVSMGSHPNTLFKNPDPNERNLYNTSQGFGFGTTPVLNTMLLRHGTAAVRRAAGNARRRG